MFSANSSYQDDKTHPAPTEKLDSSETKSECTECISDCFSTLSSPKVTGLFFLGLTIGANALNSGATEQVIMNNNNLPGTERTKEKLLAKVCKSKSANPINKPAKLTYGFNKHLQGFENQAIMMPIPCVMQKQEQCLDELALERTFVTDSVTRNTRGTKMMQERSKGEAQYGKWVLATQKQADGMSLNPEQKTIWEGIFKNLKDLMGFYLRAKTVREAQVGNCGEYASQSIMELLKKKIEYGIDLKIQVVTVESKNSPNRIKDHIFLLLDSNVGDCATKNKAQTDAIFSSILKGKVCDVWNGGFFKDLADVESSLYQNGWETIEIKTIDLAFSKFDKLPEKLQKLICRTLSSMGLTIQPASKCEFGVTQTMHNHKQAANEEESLAQEVKKVV